MNEWDLYNNKTPSIPATEEGEWPAYEEHSLFETAALEVSHHVEVVPEMARTMALAAMAVACQGAVDVEFPNGKLVPTSLNLLTIAESGERKTAVENWFFNPVRDFQQEKKTEAKKKLIEYQRDINNWKSGEKLLKKEWNKSFTLEEEQRRKLEIVNEKSRLIIEKRQAEWKELEPSPPKNYQLIYENVTPIALAHGLHINIPLACLLSSEAGSILEGQASKDLYLLNSIWSGSPVEVSRRSTPSFSVIDPRLTIALMAQPKVIDRFLEKRGEEARDNGFLSRLMVIKPNSLIGKRDGNARAVNKAVIDKFKSRANELLNESFDILESTEKKRRIISFTPTAKKKWKSIFDEIEPNMEKHGLYYHSRGHGSKLMENITRVSAIIHTFENYSGDISEEVLNYSYALCRCYSKHYLEYLAGEPEIITLTNELVREIRRLVKSDDSSNYIFNKSLIRQQGRGQTRKPEKLKSALQLLEKLGHLKSSGNSSYIFSETILGHNNPVLQNGIHYNVKELYLFKEQEYINERVHSYSRFKLKDNVNSS
tara:strand:- start:326 stop:1948 length:1623 start_codon:yes stop_codon:yes gene_type:complete